MGEPQTFRSPTALVLWAVWLLFAVANWIDLAVQGRGRESAVVAALLLLATGFAYVTAQRPRVIADDAGVTIRNPLRDHRVGWAAVAKADLADLLRVHCVGGTAKPRVISAWAVHHSRRRQFAAEFRVRRPSPETSTEAQALKVARLLTARAEAARAEAARAEAARAEAGAIAAADVPGLSQPLTSTWNARALAALIIPALILLIVWLL